MRFAATIVATLGGTFVGLLLSWSARSQGVLADPVRFFGLIPGLLLFGLGLDWWQSQAPARGLAYLQRSTFYWAGAFPLARLLQDFLVFLELRRLDPSADLAELFPAFSSPAALVAFLLFQAVFGAAVGFGLGMLARRLATLSRGAGAP
jgi:hypothetical protein